MGRSDTGAAVVDGILKFLAAGGLLATMVIAPNAIQALDKPLQAFFDKMDKRTRQREWKRVVYYMKQQKLIDYSRDYEHGIMLTTKGRIRANKANFDSLSIKRPETWDKKWRLVFFDIPEAYKQGRNALTIKLRNLGFYQLQRSAWIHPFPCREVIETVTTTYRVERYVTYIETSHIDNEKRLIERFSPVIS